MEMALSDCRSRYQSRFLSFFLTKTTMAFLGPIDSDPIAELPIKNEKYVKV